MYPLSLMSRDCSNLDGPDRFSSFHSVVVFADQNCDCIKRPRRSTMNDRFPALYIDVYIVVDEERDGGREKDVNRNRRSFILRHIILLPRSRSSSSSSASRRWHAKSSDIINDSVCLSFEEQNKNGEAAPSMNPEKKRLIEFIVFDLILSPSSIFFLAYIYLSLYLSL